MDRVKKPLVIHPILFALFPILFVFSHNIGQIPPKQLVFPIVVTILITLILWSALFFLVKNRIKAGLILCVFLIMFFSYLHINTLIDAPISKLLNILIDLEKALKSPNINIVILYRVLTDWVIFIIWVAALLLFTYLILRSHRSLFGLNTFLNATSVALILISAGNIGTFYFKKQSVLASEVL